MDAFADYLVKLAEDGKYNEKLEYAESNQKNIDRQLTKKLKKEIPFDLFELLKELSSINPNRLSIQDLEDYIRITDNMKDGVYPKIKDGIITLGKVNQNDIKKFVEPLRKEEISSQFKNPLLSEVNRLISKHGDQSFNINGNTYNGFMELGLAQVSGEISTEEYIEAVESVMKNMTDDLKSIANGMKNKISGMVSNIDAQQDIINKLSNADIDLLTDGELLQYINTTQQIYDNNNFNGARKIADIANGSSKIQDVKEIAPEVRKTVWGRKIGRAHV